MKNNKKVALITGQDGSIRLNWNMGSKLCMNGI